MGLGVLGDGRIYEAAADGRPVEACDEVDEPFLGGEVVTQVLEARRLPILIGSGTNGDHRFEVVVCPDRGNHEPSGHGCMHAKSS